MKKKSIIIIFLIISIASLYYIKIKGSMQTQQQTQENFHNSLNDQDQKNFDQLQNEGTLDEATREVENGAKNITHLLNGFSNTARNLIASYLAYLGYKNIETGGKEQHPNEEKGTSSHNQKDPHDHTKTHDHNKNPDIVID